MRGLYELINSLCYNRAPVGADYDKGYYVGDQALGNLHAGGRVTVCQVANSQICCSSPSNTVAAQRRQRTC
jgi:hypothetical protein